MCAESVNARLLCCMIAVIEKELIHFGANGSQYEVEVNKDGQVELTVPFPAGAHVTVFVVDAGDAFADLLYASQSSQKPRDVILREDFAFLITVPKSNGGGWLSHYNFHAH